MGVGVGGVAVVVIAVDLCAVQFVVVAKSIECRRQGALCVCVCVCVYAGVGVAKQAFCIC